MSRTCPAGRSASGPARPGSGRGRRCVRAGLRCGRGSGGRSTRWDWVAGRRVGRGRGARRWRRARRAAGRSGCAAATTAPRAGSWPRPARSGPVRAGRRPGRQGRPGGAGDDAAAGTGHRAPWHRGVRWTRSQSTGRHPGFRCRARRPGCRRRHARSADVPYRIAGRGRDGSGSARSSRDTPGRGPSGRGLAGAGRNQSTVLRGVASRIGRRSPGRRGCSRA